MEHVARLRTNNKSDDPTICDVLEPIAKGPDGGIFGIRDPEMLAVVRTVRAALGRQREAALRSQETTPIETKSAAEPAKPRKTKKIGPNTEIAWEALGAYQRAHPNFKPGAGMAEKIIAFAIERGIATAKDLDPNGAFGKMIAAYLRGYTAPTVAHPKSVG